ncbi:radical SAM protein, partial [candidate division WOR-3 bacterium]|nr:radical SAM protein [candidate division WOR-3 bacterium]
MPSTTSFTDRFDRDIRELFRSAWRTSAKRPAQAAWFLRVIGWQQQARRRRARWAGQGVHVPPLAIVSITNRCNLACKGCYSRALRETAGPELTVERFRGLLGEADELGIGIIMLAGGEPLVRPELLDIAAGFARTVFPVFTNGLLIDERFMALFQRHRNLIPVLSIEGYREETDGRRGTGVFERLRLTAGRLAGKGLFHGVSLTVTSRNVPTILDEHFVESLMAAGTRAFFFVEYVPVKDGTDDWCLTDAQKQHFLVRLDEFRRRFPGLFIAFPGDEE